MLKLIVFCFEMFKLGQPWVNKVINITKDSYTHDRLIFVLNSSTIICKIILLNASVICVDLFKSRSTLPSME